MTRHEVNIAAQRAFNAYVEVVAVNTGFFPTWAEIGTVAQQGWRAAVIAVTDSTAKNGKEIAA